MYNNLFETKAEKGTLGNCPLFQSRNPRKLRFETCLEATETSFPNDGFLAFYEHDRTLDETIKRGEKG